MTFDTNNNLKTRARSIQYLVWVHTYITDAWLSVLEEAKLVCTNGESCRTPRVGSKGRLAYIRTPFGKWVVLKRSAWHHLLATFSNSSRKCRWSSMPALSELIQWFTPVSAQRAISPDASWPFLSKSDVATGQDTDALALASFVGSPRTLFWETTQLFCATTSIILDWWKEWRLWMTASRLDERQSANPTMTRRGCLESGRKKSDEEKMFELLGAHKSIERALLHWLRSSWSLERSLCRS